MSTVDAVEDVPLTEETFGALMIIQTRLLTIKPYKASKVVDIDQIDLCFELVRMSKALAQARLSLQQAVLHFLHLF